MSNLQNTLESLQPYLIGIRYLDGKPVVDTIFKDGWTLPNSEIIKRVRGNEELNYYMLFSESDGIGLDELLGYVETTIKANIEREKKHELLKDKVTELKELFKKTSLTKLRNLKFIFSDDDLVPDIDDFKIDEQPIEESIKQPVSIEKQLETDTAKENQIENPELSDEEAEMLEEEIRAENFRKYKEYQKINGGIQKISQKIELPPKTNNVDNNNQPTTCECGPDEACNICIETKGF